MSRITVDKDTIFIDCDPNIKCIKPCVVISDHLMISDLPILDFYKHFNKVDPDFLKSIKYAVVLNMNVDSKINLENLPSLAYVAFLCSSADVNGKVSLSGYKTENISNQPLSNVSTLKIDTNEAILSYGNILDIFPNVKSISLFGENYKGKNLNEGKREINKFLSDISEWEVKM